MHPLYYLWEFNKMDIMQTRTELSKTKHSRKSSYSFKVRPLVGKIQTKLLPRATLIHFSDVRINYFEVWPEFQKETWKPRSQNYNPGLNCLLWTSQLVFNLMRWSSSMRPIKLTVTGLIPCGREINQSATQFRFWIYFLQGNEVDCLFDQRSVLGALSNHKNALFHLRYFENGPLEPGYRSRGASVEIFPGEDFQSFGKSSVVIRLVFVLFGWEIARDLPLVIE